MMIGPTAGDEWVLCIDPPTTEMNSRVELQQRSDGLIMLSEDEDGVYMIYRVGVVGR